MFSLRTRWFRLALMSLASALFIGTSAAAQDIPVQAYSLEDVIGVALQNNRTLETSRLDLKAANEQVREAWGSLYPTIDGSVRYLRNLAVQETFLPAFIFDPDAPPNELVPVRFGSDNNWNANLTVRQPIFDAGAFIGVGAAGRFKALQEEAVRGSAQLTVTRVRRAYYRALLAHEAARVIEESVRRTGETLRETEGLNRVGLASSYDVLRLRVRLSNLRPDVRRAVNAAAAAERVLSVEMGMDKLSQINVLGELHTLRLTAAGENQDDANKQLLRLVGYPNALEASFEELLAVALENRSELRQARLSRDLENARVKFERTSYYPKLSAFFNYRIFAQEDGSLDPFGERSNQRTTTSQVGLELEIPIFQGFERSARVQQRSAALRQAELLVDQLEQQVANQIRTAVEALEEAKLRAQTQAGAVSEARRGFEIVSAQYLAGTSSQLEQTEGEVLWRESELRYAEAVYDYLIAQAALDEALGVVPMVDVDKPEDLDLRISLSSGQSEREVAHDVNR